MLDFLICLRNGASGFGLPVVSVIDLEDNSNDRCRKGSLELKSFHPFGLAVRRHVKTINNSASTHSGQPTQHI